MLWGDSPLFLSMIKKYILSFFVCLSLFVCSFTAVTFADTTLYSVTSNGRDVRTDVYMPPFSTGSNRGYSAFLTVGTASVDSVFLGDITFDVSYVQFTDGVVITISYKPMSATYDGQSAVYPITAFDGTTVAFLLPQRRASDALYTDTWELVTLTIGGNYGGKYTDLFLTFGNSSAGIWDTWSDSDNIYHHFRIDTRYTDFSNGVIYTGSYSQYSGVDLLMYVAQTLEALAGYTDGMFVRTSFAYDIDYFPDVLSYADREELKKLDDLSDKLTDVDGSINDIKDILTQSPNITIKPPPEIDLPDTGEDGFLSDFDIALEDFDRYKDVVIELLPNISDDIFGDSAFVIRRFIYSSFDTLTFSVTNDNISFSPYWAIIWLSFVIGVIAIIKL